MMQPTDHAEPPLKAPAQSAARWPQRIRRLGYLGLAACTLGFGLVALALLFDFDFRFEDPQERAIRDFASGHRTTDLRFPGAIHQPVRAQQNLASEFDLSSSELSFVEQELDAALAADPGNSRNLFRRAQVHLLYLQPSPAIEVLERLRLFSPEDPALLGALGYAHYLKGRAERNAGDLLRASDFFERALRYQPENEELLFNAAIAQQRLGNRSEAIVLFQRFLKQGTDDGWAREARTRLQELSR